MPVTLSSQPEYIRQPKTFRRHNGQPPMRENSRVRFAVASWEKKAAKDVRRSVFVQEQGIFKVDDKDEFDQQAISIIATHSDSLAFNDSADSCQSVIGTVRIHRDNRPGVWWGSRLAVVAEHRGSHLIPATLIRRAVAAAKVAGCERFFAHIQPQNQHLFERIGWRVLQPTVRENREHLLIEANLARFNPERILGSLGMEWACYLDAKIESKRWSSSHVHPISGEPIDGYNFNTTNVAVIL